MIIKHKAQDLLLLLGLTFAFAISFITYEQNSDILFSNIEQKIQTLDLGFSSPQKFSHLVNRLPEIIKGKIFGYKNRPQLERIDINIKLTDYKKILNNRSQAIKSGQLSKPTLVNAKIIYKNKLINAKLRLKGILIDHWLSRYRMSFRVALKDNNYILGFKKFSLQKPESRQHPLDQLFSSLLNHSGNLSTIHKYIHVYVNGSDWGVMNIEEHVSKEFLEKQKRKESLIFRFGNGQRDNLFYNELHRKNNYKMYRLSDPRLYTKLYGRKKYLKNDLYRRWYSYISRGKLSGTQLYSIDSYSRALLLASIWNDGHPLHFGNSRHYFNPYTLRLEPIVSDAWLAFPIKNTGFFPRQKFDPFLNRFIYQSISLTKEFQQNLDLNLNMIGKALEQGNEILTGYEDYFPLDPKINILTVLQENYLFIKNNKHDRIPLLDNKKSSSDIHDDLLFVVHYKSGQFIIFNRSPNEVTLTGLLLKDKQFSIPPIKVSGYDIKDYSPISFNVGGIPDIPSKNIKIIATHQGSEFVQVVSTSIKSHEYKIPRQPHSKIKPEKPTKFESKTFPVHLYANHYDDGTFEIFNLLPDEVHLEAIYVEKKPIPLDPIVIPGYTIDKYEPYTIKTRLTGILDDKISIQSSYQDKINTTQLGVTLINRDLLNPLQVDTPTNSPFIVKDNNDWRIPKGTWSVKSPITIQGNLTIEAGAHLIFSENAYLIIKGAIRALGTAETPIKFTASKNHWKGIYVFQAKKRSLFKHALIQNTSSLVDGILSLTGGVTFYQSDVDIENVIFDSSTAEDMLNIVKSNFDLNHVELENGHSDGIDFDFSTGAIKNSVLKNITGDGLDFSGSQVKLEHIEASNIKDKAVSAGEESLIHIENSYIKNIGVGLASKDGSQLVGENLNIRNYQLHAAMTYVKKGFYTKKPELMINVSQINNHKNAFFRQKGTTLSVDGTEISEKILDVKSLYKSEIMKK